MKFMQKKPLRNNLNLTVPLNSEDGVQGILLINKPRGKTSFSMIAALRKLLGVQKIGHAGTLDPFATGVMVLLIGRRFTRLSDQFLHCDKEYLAQVHLGVVTDTYDCDGAVMQQSDGVPSRAELDGAIAQFQGEIDQIPPMFSAKKVNGKKLYELARKGRSIERKPVKVKVNARILNYEYPYVHILVTCSKGTYIRSLAYDLGNLLGCGAHLSNLQRMRSGQFHLRDCFDGALFQSPDLDMDALRAHIQSNLESIDAGNSQLSKSSR